MPSEEGLSIEMIQMTSREVIKTQLIALHIRLMNLGALWRGNIRWNGQKFKFQQTLHCILSDGSIYMKESSPMIRFFKARIQLHWFMTSNWVNMSRPQAPINTSISKNLDMPCRIRPRTSVLIINPRISKEYQAIPKAFSRFDAPPI